MFQEVHLIRKKITYYFNDKKKTLNNILSPAVGFTEKFYIESEKSDLTSQELETFFLALLESGKFQFSELLQKSNLDELDFHIEVCNTREIKNLNFLGMFNIPIDRKDKYILVVYFKNRNFKSYTKGMLTNTQVENKIIPFVDIFSLHTITSREECFNLKNPPEQFFTSKYSFVRSLINEQFLDRQLKKEQEDEDRANQPNDSA